MDDYFTASEKAVALALKHDHEAAMQVSNGAGRAARGKLVETVSQRVEANRKALATEKQEAADVAASAMQTLTIIAAVGLLLALGLLGTIAIVGCRASPEHHDSLDEPLG